MGLWDILVDVTQQQNSRLGFRHAHQQTELAIGEEEEQRPGLENGARQNERSLRGTSVERIDDIYLVREFDPTLSQSGRYRRR